jgi:hypothetical protein
MPAFIGARRTLLSRRPVAATYRGPGDIVSGASAWGSSARAYNAAYAAPGTNPAMDLQDQAGANPITIAILSTGFVNIAAINAWVTAHSVSTIKIAKIYDQTGTGNHFTQGTLANMPTLVLNALGGLPGMAFLNSGSQQLATPTLTLTAPYSFSAVSLRTTNDGLLSGIIESTSVQIGLAYTTTANQVEILNNGHQATGTASDGAFHALQGTMVQDGSTLPVMVVDGTPNTGIASSGAGISAATLRIGRSEGGQTMGGTITEVGVWASLAFNSTQYGNVNTNQHSATYGYNF